MLLPNKMISQDANVTRCIKHAILPPSPRIPSHLAKDMVKPLRHKNQALKAGGLTETQTRGGTCDIRKWEECIFCFWEGRLKCSEKCTEKQWEVQWEVLWEARESRVWERSGLGARPGGALVLLVSRDFAKAGKSSIWFFKSLLLGGAIGSPLLKTFES